MSHAQNPEEQRRPEGWDVCLAELQTIIQSPIKKNVRVSGGNNATFIFTATSGQRAVGKFYHRDERQRLVREWHACSWLHAHGFDVPRPLYQNERHQFGAYSWERGEHVLAKDATAGQVHDLVDILCRLHGYQPSAVDEAFPMGIAAVTTKRETINDQEKRLQEIDSAIATGAMHPLAAELVKSSKICERFARAREVYDQQNQIDDWALTPEQLRLCPVDWGFHNTLFRSDGSPVLIDLEYFGWDDPLHTLADFVTHDKTQGLSPDLINGVAHQYSNTMQLSAEEQGRLRFHVTFGNLTFVAIYLQSVTPVTLERRQFSAAGHFDVERYIHEQIAKAERRLASVLESLL